MLSTVAIVDDDLDISNALGMWLNLHALHSAPHHSGESLLSSIQQEDGHLITCIDKGIPVRSQLVGAVIDLNLPGVSGIELARALRTLDPDLPITIITALSADELAHFGNLPEGIRCLEKPFDLNELENALFPLFQ
ncbi:MAG: response regulator [Methylomicrobium sp.]|nr:response regulator [Methylomicrobium sp.]